VSLLDNTAEEPKSKLRRYVITGVAFAALLTSALWYLFHFYPEKRAAVRFFDSVVAGDFQRAYQIWKPSASYSFQDFLDDWGPKGYYGPVKSYHIESVQSPRHGGSGVILVVELSPDQPFPADTDASKNRRLKEVRLWVESRDKSLSFPP
jgi:hypothetical protein